MSTLEGIRVLELGGWTAGPLLGMMLADHGADVVRVVPPGGEMAGDPEAALYHRGKRLVALDLRDARQLALARRLALGADVLIANYRRPGTLVELGLDPSELRRANPALVACTLPAWPPGHPLAGRPGWDGVIGAEAGLHSHPAELKPRFVPLPLVGVLAALYGAVGIAAALLARERDGHGQRICVPLLDTALAAQTFNALLSVDPPHAWRSLQWAASPFLGTWQTEDGGHVYLHLGQPRHLARFLDRLEELGEGEEVAAWRARLHPDTLADPMAVRSLRESRWVRRRLAALLATRTARQWESLLGEVGLCCTMCRSSEAWLAHPQPRSTGEVVEVEHPRMGTLVQPGVQVRLSASPGSPGAPPLGWEDAAALADAWPPLPHPTGAPDDRPPLAGRTVLDLTRIIAGPLAGRLLAELGARVVQVGDPHLRPAWLEAMRVAFDPGKESALLDLSRPEGRRALHGLVERLRPDAVLENWRRGVAERLGADEATLRARVPDLVYASISAWGRAGPWGDRPGWEQTAQAATGIQARYGADGSPELLPLAVTDVGTGLAAALGVLLALLHRERGGPGQAVEVSLSSTALLTQAPLLYRYERADRLGSRPLHRLVRLADGWVFLGAPSAALNAMWKVKGLRGAVEAPDRAGFIAERFAAETLATWRQRLEEAGLDGAVELRPVRSLRDFARDPTLAERGLLTRRHHPGLGRVTEVRTPVRLWRTPLRTLPPTGRRGDQSRVLLAGDDPGPAVAPGPDAVDELSTSQRAGWWWHQARWGAALLWRRR